MNIVLILSCKQREKLWLNTVTALVYNWLWVTVFTWSWSMTEIPEVKIESKSPWECPTIFWTRTGESFFCVCLLNYQIWMQRSLVLKISRKIMIKAKSQISCYCMLGWRWCTRHGFLRDEFFSATEHRISNKL